MAREIERLSQRDIDVLRDVVRNQKHSYVGGIQRYTPDSQIAQTPDVYIALVPEGGIPSLNYIGTGTSQVGTGTWMINPSTGNVGTGSNYGLGETPGYALCSLYEIVWMGTLKHVPVLRPIGDKHLVYNLTFYNVIQEDQPWVVVERDKWGRWLVNPESPVSQLFILPPWVYQMANQCVYRYCPIYYGPEIGTGTGSHAEYEIVGLTEEETCTNFLTGAITRTCTRRQPSDCCPKIQPGTGSGTGSHPKGVTPCCVGYTLPSSVCITFTGCPPIGDTPGAQCPPDFTCGCQTCWPARKGCLGPGFTLPSVSLGQYAGVIGCITNTPGEPADTNLYAQFICSSFSPLGPTTWVLSVQDLNTGGILFFYGKSSPSSCSPLSVTLANELGFTPNFGTTATVTPGPCGSGGGGNINTQCCPGGTPPNLNAALFNVANMMGLGSLTSPTNVPIAWNGTNYFGSIVGCGGSSFIEVTMSCVFATGYVWRVTVLIQNTVVPSTEIGFVSTMSPLPNNCSAPQFLWADLPANVLQNISNGVCCYTGSGNGSDAAIGVNITA